MSVFAEMPGYNRNNPFVILFHQAKVRLDELYLEMTKHFIIMVFVFAIFSIAGLVVSTIPDDSGLTSSVILSSILMLIIVLLGAIAMRECVGDPIRSDIEKIMKREISEVAVMGNEEVSNASHRLYELTGKVISLNRTLIAATWTFPIFFILSAFCGLIF